MTTTETEHENDSLVLCANSQGTVVRASLMRMTRYVVSFEVYNPYSILQLSEVLSDFRIVVSGNILYQGRALVTNLVNTGIVLVCEASLDDDGWRDVELLSPSVQLQRLEHDFDHLVQEWSKVEHVTPDLKVVVADIQALLIDMRRWLEQVEMSIRSAAPAERTQFELQVIERLNEITLPLTKKLFERFESVTGAIAQEASAVHRAYTRRQLHPLVLCSPFVHRSFQKPLGYAGDYEMVNMILRNPLEGSSLFAKLVNAHFLAEAPAQAHRNRVQYLTAMIQQETRRCVKVGKTGKFFNLGCGPAMEIREFLTFDDLCERSEFTLLDFNDETLANTSQAITDIKMRHRRGTRVQLIRRSVHQILKEGARASEMQSSGPYDVVYCAGLFDYLSDRICRRLLEIFYELVTPGGLVVATNVEQSNPARGVMEHLMEWHLIYRSQEQFSALVPSMVPHGLSRVIADNTKVNIFLEIRKPANGCNGT